MSFEITLGSELLVEVLHLWVVQEVLYVCHVLSIGSAVHGLIALWAGDKVCAP